jgi:probable phosphoglycerate mutase
MIYLVRHGRTAFNEQGRHQGGLDSPLTALGRDQAARVGQLLRRLIADPADWSLVASPLGRTVHTSQIIAAEIGHGVAFKLDARLAELRMGRFEGLTHAEIDLAWPGLRAEADRHEFLFQAPDGEPYDVFAARLGEWLNQALADPRPTLAVTHGMSMRVLRGLYLNLDRAEALRLESPQDAVFKLDAGVVERINA